MNTTTKPYLTRVNGVFQVKDHTNTISGTDFNDARSILAWIVETGITVEQYIDATYEDGIEEPTCWVCDGYHGNRGCPIDAADDRYDDYPDDSFGY